MTDLLTIITVGATLATALATAVLAALTYLLALENKRLRLASSEPRVVPYLAPHPDGNGAVNFVLSNVGLGPAFNVQFTLVNDEADFTAHQTSLHNDRERSAFMLPQGENLTALFGIGYVLFGNGGKEQGPRLKPFDVEVSYAAIDGKPHRTRHTIDIAQFSGLVGIASKSAFTRIADSIANIDRHMGTLAGNAARVIQFADTTKMSDSHRTVQKAGAPNTPPSDGDE